VSVEIPDRQAFGVVERANLHVPDLRQRLEAASDREAVERFASDPSDMAAPSGA